MTQSLNMLPVGQIDGGRVTQTGFGRAALGATSFGVYLGLSLGIIGSSLSLSWALYVLICQRTPEFSPQDDVTEVSSTASRRGCSSSSSAPDPAPRGGPRSGVQRRHADAVSARAGGTRHDVTGAPRAGRVDVGGRRGDGVRRALW